MAEKEAVQSGETEAWGKKACPKPAADTEGSFLNFRALSESSSLEEAIVVLVLDPSYSKHTILVLSPREPWDILGMQRCSLGEVVVKAGLGQDLVS